MADWGATQAKAQFSAVLDKAESEGPQLVQRRKTRFVVLMEEELTRRESAASTSIPQTSGQSLWDALRMPSTHRYDMDFPRLKSKARAVKF
jgi:Antitoxin Phd_YefM, type II toxin-antitoxin system